jgi:hypothetical protein
MIKIIEKIKDYISDKYWDFITDREFNGKDPNYFGDVSDKIAEEVHDFLSDLIAEEEALTESRTSERNLESHFEKHCVGNGKKSSDKYIRYDFTTADKYRNYENIISDKVLHPDYKIISLSNTVMVFSALSEITVQPTSVLFDAPCGFENSHGTFKIGLNAFANDVTTNYGSSNTINLMILSKENKTISMFPVDSTLIENKFTKIVNKYKSYKKVKKLYNELEKDKNNNRKDI